jgi:methylase of polypeptide subunit release factors
MIFSSVSQFPVPDQTAATELGASLRRVGYSENALQELLGEDAYSADRTDAPVDARRLPDTPIGTAVRALFLQLPVSRSSAARALGERGVEALASTGLATVGRDVDPRARILPVGSILLASDGYSRDGDDPPDYVATYTPTARVLDSLTPRPRVERALDVGTGSGVHALLAAQHARQVIATDVNPRALAYTQLNAALNGLTNVECRQGSLFDPVEGEVFDLVTCNAPYVVSPERRWAYRDSGFQEDEVSARVVAAAASHLAEGGFASLLVSWLAEDEDAPDERVLAWVQATGCSGWILPTQGSDPLDHAAEWNSHLAGDPEALAGAVEEWERYFERLGVRWISEGAVLLHRQANTRQSVRLDPVDEEDLDDAGDQIQRAFGGWVSLAELSSPAALLDSRISLAMPLRLERELEPRANRAVDAEGRIELAEGMKQAVDATADAQEVIASLDGGLTLRGVLEATGDRLALADDELAQLQDEVVDLVELLIELGALQMKS